MDQWIIDIKIITDISKNICIDIVIQMCLVFLVYAS